MPYGRIFGLSLGVAAMIGTAVVTTSAQAGGMLPDARLYAAGCFNCHGPNGKSAGVNDAIDDLSVRKFMKKMKKFKKKGSDATIMDRITRGYTNEELQLMAEQFVKLNQD